MAKKVNGIRKIVAYIISLLLIMGAPVTTALVGGQGTGTVGAITAGMLQLIFSAVYAWTSGVLRPIFKDNK